MGSIIYEFLSDSFLFNKALQEEDYSSIPEDELKRELTNYREHALSNLAELGREIKGVKARLKLFGDRDYLSTRRLIQTALYLDQVVLPDPIFSFTREDSKVSKSMSEFLGMPQTNKIDRAALSVAASKMKAFTPMVTANYLKFFPVSYYLEPEEKIPLTFSQTGFSDVLPPAILSQYRKNVDVKALKKTDQGWIVEEALKLGRGIAVQFKQDNDDNMHIYNLFEQEVVKMDEATRIVHFKMTLPEEPPAIDQFEAWVNQSVNQAARAHYDQLLKAMMLSSYFGSSFLTGSEFTYSLLGAGSSNQSISGYMSDSVLNLDLPFFENIAIEDIMSVRVNDGEAFDLFRKELEGKFRELRTETDQEILRIKIQNIVHELNEVQVTKISQKIKDLRKGALAQLVVAAGGLAGSVVTSGASIAATLVAFASGFHSYSEYKEKVRQNPAYFLWKVKNK